MTLADALSATHKAAFETERGWEPKEFTDLLANPGVWLIGTAQAFVLARLVADEAEILTLATHPDCRRQGLARTALCQFHAQARAKGANSAFLEVAADNAPACALYLNASYQQVGQRRGYYRRLTGPNADALVLRRDLP